MSRKAAKKRKEELIRFFFAFFATLRDTILTYLQRKVMGLSISLEAITK
jgi:hypothetical protein